jgi:hypothetical protein
MPSKTFVLGAGFSVTAGFPLVRNLRTDVISWIEAEQHPSAKPHLTPYLHGYPEGQFYAGLKEIDPSGSRGFEELMIAARDRLSATYLHDPAYTLDRVLRDACGRLLWHRQRMLDRSAPIAYQNFASWFHEHHSYGQTNAIISLNWDLLAEKVLSDAKAGWLYTTQSPFVPILKPHGSINWSSHLEQGLSSPGWQPIAPGSTYCYIPDAPFSDPFESGANQRYRKLILPGDPEGAGGANLILQEAENAILDRDTIVFIGYSLPDYDAFSTEFFQRASAGKQIEVYTRSIDTLEHYKRMLGTIATTAPVPFEHCPYAKPFVEAATV